MTFEYADVAWYFGMLILSYSIGFVGGVFHRVVIQLTDIAK